MLLNQKKQTNGYLLTFILCFATAFFILLPFMVVDKGFFLYCGDFNSQQIPFYTYANDIIRSGGANYSWATDLGSSFVTSYSFYLLGSPMFWLSCLFPTSFIPFLMAPLLALKFAVTGVGAYAFLIRYIKDRNHTIFAAIIYTFSGFSIYNIFFNHFIEPIMLFPFLLWSMDNFFHDKKRGGFAIMVALNLLNSFFFFTGQVVFCIIYFVVKLICKEYKFNLKEFLLFIFEGLVGILIAMCLFLPSTLDLLANPRALKFTDGMDLVVYTKSQQYFAILSSAFLPPDPPYMPNIFTEASVKWTSLSAYLPLCSFAGVLCYLKTFKKTMFSRVLLVCIVMAFVPILNSAFYAFNSSYYARWYYMPILIMSACTALAIKNSTRAQMQSAIVTTGIITSIHLIFALLPTKVTDDETDEVSYILGVVKDHSKLLLSVLTALLGLLLFYMLIKIIKNKQKRIMLLICCVMAFTVFYSIVHLSLGKFPQWEKDSAYKLETYDEKDALLEFFPDDEFYRIDAYECFSNIGLHLNIPCIQFFNSTVSPSIMEFYPAIGVDRAVNSKPEFEKYAARGLLSVKYTLLQHDDLTEFFEINNTEGFVEVHKTDEYTILENENYIPMGFVYDYYITQKQFDAVHSDSRSNLLLRGILLSDEQIEKYGDILEPLPDEKKGNLMYSYFVEDCKQLNQNAAENFTATTDGFSANITLDQDNLVFFSVPYDKGFKALVNGEPVEIEKVSAGMLAIYCEEGDNDIQVTYNTVGFNLGVVLSVIGLVILVIYLLCCRMRKKPSPPQPLIDFPNNTVNFEIKIDHYLQNKINNTNQQTGEL